MTAQPNSLSAKDTRYLIHPYTNLRRHETKGPLIIKRGDGVWVEDEEGNRYLEGLSGLWCTSLGFSEKRLAEAALAQLQTLPYNHTFAGRATEPVILLAEKLIAMAPETLSKVFFVNSGSEAIDTALKLTWYYNNARGKPNKKRIIARRRGYHGITIAAGHVTGLPYARAGFDLPMADRFFHLTAPSYYREGRPGESEMEFSQRLANELETLIMALGAETIAAFIAEPVMGAGGVIVPPKGYFDLIQPILKRHDILFIADEVINGFYRTGHRFGCDHFAIRPDLMTVAKQLSSAYLPIGGVLMSDAFFDVIADQSAKLGTLGMGYTYGGHPVAAAVALKTLEIYEEDRILERVQRVSPRFQNRCRAMAGHPLVGEARGLGLLGGLEIVKSKETRDQYPTSMQAAANVAEACLAQGLIVRPLPGDSIGICPPLIIDEGEIDTLFDRLWAGLDTASRHLAMET